MAYTPNVGGGAMSVDVDPAPQLQVSTQTATVDVTSGKSVAVSGKQTLHLSAVLILAALGLIWFLRYGLRNA